MRRTILFSSVAVALCLFGVATESAFGQITGCVDSPEDPTVVMAVLGIAAASVPFAWSRIRNRHR